MTDDEKLGALVSEALKNARENGYWTRRIGEDDVETIAADLCDLDADVQNLLGDEPDLERVKPHVRVFFRLPSVVA